MVCCMAGDGHVSYGWRQRLLVWPETVMSSMVRDGGISYGQRRKYPVWAERVMSHMARDDY